MRSLAIKLFGCLLLVAASFSAGCYTAKSLYRRRDFLKSFIVFLGALATNIRYNSDDIFTAVSASAEGSGLNVFAADNKQTVPFDSFWSNCVGAIPKSNSLSKDDVRLLYDFGAQLGVTDIEGQLKHIHLYTKLFEKQLSDAEDAVSSKAKLYRTLGFFAGSAAALIMI